LAEEKGRKGREKGEREERGGRVEEERRGEWRERSHIIIRMVSFDVPCNENQKFPFEKRYQLLLDSIDSESPFIVSYCYFLYFYFYF
jgi:hypothetical protein